MAITDRQRANRSRGLGASDIPAMLGLDPFRNAADLLADKRGLIQQSGDDFPSEAAEIGTFLEDGVAQIVSRRLGKQLVKPTSTYTHPGGAPMFANLDRQIERAARGEPVVEIKTTGRVDDWREPGTCDPITAIPTRVLVQVQAQMACSGSPIAFVGVLLSGYGGRKTVSIYDIPYRADIAEPIVQEATRWWTSHVVNGEPLPPTVEPPHAEVLASLRRVEGECVPIPDDLIKQMIAAKAAAKAAEEAAELAERRVRDALGTATIGTGSFGEYEYRKLSSESLDSAALRKEHPDIAAQFVRASTYRRAFLKLSKEWKAKAALSTSAE